MPVRGSAEQDRSTLLQEIADSLGDEATAWVGTARAQAVGPELIPLILQSGRTRPGPHDRWTARLLAIAKIGESGIGQISARLATVAVASDVESTSETKGLIKVLASIGPAAIPALVDVASIATVAWVRADALEQIVTLEPRRRDFGQEDPSPWRFWRPADDRSDGIERAITPLLPQLETLMYRELPGWQPYWTAPQRPAAYLLARWGTGETRMRGIEVLNQLARAEEDFFKRLESIELLSRVGAPTAASHLHDTLARVPEANELKEGYLLRALIALYQVGDPTYARLLDTPLRSQRTDICVEAIHFARSTGNVALVDSLIPLLENNTVTREYSTAMVDGKFVSTLQTIGDVALEAIRDLTLQSFGRDERIWQTWRRNNRNVERKRLLSAWLALRMKRVANVPIWQANQWISDLSTTRDPQILPFIDTYLARPDLNVSKSGPDGLSVGTAGIGPVGMYGPKVVTLLLRFAQDRIPGSRKLLANCLHAKDPGVRIYGALALSAFDRTAAVEQLTLEVISEPLGEAPEFLLKLGDARGISAMLERLDSREEFIRQFACRDLRIYTQQPFSCEARLPDDQRTANAARWRYWWQANERTFRVKERQAALDEAASVDVPAVSFQAGKTIAANERSRLPPIGHRDRQNQGK